MIAGNGPGYRHRVRLSARRGPKGLELGLFEEGSHRLVAIPDCVVHHASIRRLHAVLERGARALGVEAYDEEKHQGLLRAVQLAVERQSGRVQVVLVVRDRLGPASHAARLLRPWLDQLAREELVHSSWLNAQPERTNTLLGERFEHVFGPDAIVDVSGGARVFYPPGAFGQANPALHDLAVARIHAAIPHGARVAEYHAGVGTIGLGLVGRNVVAFNEIGPGSLQGLERGLAELRGANEVRPLVARGPADEHLGLLDDVDCVIVDPPRKGLSAGLLAALTRRRPRLVAYLSCGLDSFLRDAEQLVQAGYAVSGLTALGYFPFTEHVETLALLKMPGTP